MGEWEGSCNVGLVDGDVDGPRAMGRVRMDLISLSIFQVWQTISTHWTSSIHLLINIFYNVSDANTAAMIAFDCCHFALVYHQYFISPYSYRSYISRT